MKSKLTFLEATGIIVGAGVGGGVMAVPYLATMTRPATFVIVVAIAVVLNVILNLLLTEVLIRDGKDLQIVELMRHYVFKGRWGEPVSWVFFSVLGLSFIASLTAYVAGAGDVIADITPLAPIVSRLLVYVFSAAIVFLGLKSVGVSEKIALFLLLVFVVVIVVGSNSSWNPLSRVWDPGGARRRAGAVSAPASTLALFGVVMYSLNAAFAVPQAVRGLSRHPARSIGAVVLGTIVNASLIVVLTLVAIAVSEPVTQVAVIGIADAVRKPIAIAGSLFVVVAMLTTYWSVSLALGTIIQERTGADRRLSWLLATAPTLVLILTGVLGFLEYLQVAGGIVALVVVYVTVPVYVRARREHALPQAVGRAPAALFGWMANPVVLGLFVLGMVVMSIGSFLGIA